MNEDLLQTLCKKTHSNPKKNAKDRVHRSSWTKGKLISPINGI